MNQRINIFRSLKNKISQKISRNILVFENFRIAFASIRSNALRSVLTILIITIGIMALVGILTAIDAIKNSINSEFSRMGANTFTITSRGMHIQIGDNRYRTKNHAAISHREAERFKNEFDFPASVALSTRATGTGTVKYLSLKTNPNTPVLGVDENFLFNSGNEIEKGRNFTQQEVRDGKNYVVVGTDIVTTLFKNNENPIDKVVSIGNGKYRIVGILKKRGSSMGGNEDKICFIPYTNVRQYFPQPNMTYRISVKPQQSYMMEAAISESEGLFRVIRGLSVKDESDFNIVKSDNLANLLLENIRYVTVAATLIGIITLFGAAIGLMNIMLVAVAERTREIGTRKAIGATSKTIKQQFLFEAILIGQLGGFFGILLGILIGNMVSMMVSTAFIIPWMWIFGGVILCLGVSLASGLMPAIKASKLDPIEALRYE